MENELVELNRRNQELESNVNETRIVSKETLMIAVTLASDIKESLKKVESIRKFFVDPLNVQVKAINAKFKPFSEKLEQFESQVKGKIVVYQIEQEKIRQAEEDRLRKLQEKEYAKQLRKSERLDTPPPPPPPPIKVEAPKVEGLQIKKLWDFTVLDETKIPREYLCIDEKKIRKVVNAGVREIAGVRIFERTISAISSNNGDEL